MPPLLSPAEREARLRMNTAWFMRPDWCRRLVELHGSACAVLGQTAAELAESSALPLKNAEKFLADCAAADAAGELRAAADCGGRVVFPEDEDFPPRLAGIPDAPFLVYVKGDIGFGGPAVAVVGARYPDAYGRRMCSALAAELAGAGFLIVSGLARGIDTAAHEAALARGGRTWAVVGTGLGKCYPPENRGLEERILKAGGAVISEFPVSSGPAAHHFPRRNRLVSGLCGAVLVVQGDIKSGSLITARVALEQGREVLAVPGQADEPLSAGPNRLIRDGAVLVQTAKDVLDSYPPQELFGIMLPAGEPEAKTARAVALEGLSADERALLECIGGQELPVDVIAQTLNWDIPRTAGALFELEIKSLVSAAAGLYAKN
ncbi:MAG: DNA-processing protein DprA [Elusimicrobiaceae bacterium]|nr:DNA-processing protein DprA [Elusimicrobiaceae bacterium]